MDAVRKAVWFIESHFAEPIGLDEIAAAGGLSRFHFARTFGQATGLSASAYLRGRRLTEAARALAAGASDILTVALGVGYGSHEAFTRAFRDAFGTTPEAVRASGCVDHLTLTEPLTMTEAAYPPLPAPTLVDKGPFLLAGLRAYRLFTERGGIPGQWQAFGAHLHDLPGRIGGDSFGVCLAPASGDEGFDYLCAAAVRSLDDLPEGLSGVRLSRRCFAVFPHAGHVATIGATCAAIFETWAPSSGMELETAPLFLLEHYTEAFNPATGVGGIELWAPLQASPG